MTTLPVSDASAASYPSASHGRDRWILQQRGPRNTVSASVPYAFLHEEEYFGNGDVGSVSTILLTNRECPWRCAMCDLWKNTLTETVAFGSIPAQIEHALSRLPPARQIKLYNSGSFFDPRAIPPVDYPAIASLVNHFERVIVECHPALIQESCFQFQSLLSTQLEVAMGLETVHPAVLEKLNKKMTLDQYKSAAARLLARDIDLRSFVLVQPPFMAIDESLNWACRSIDFAFGCRATAVTLIPTRAGNGAMDSLARSAEFSPPALSVLEDAFAYGVSLQANRVFLDLWNIDNITSAPCCRTERLNRLRAINLSQHLIEPVICDRCRSRS